MSLFKNLFGKKDQAPVEPMHGRPATQSQAEQDVTRQRMESEMAGQKERRKETLGARSPGD